MIVSFRHGKHINLLITFFTSAWKKGRFNFNQKIKIIRHAPLYALKHKSNYRNKWEKFIIQLAERDLKDADLLLIFALLVQLHFISEVYISYH